MAKVQIYILHLYIHIVTTKEPILIKHKLKPDLMYPILKKIKKCIKV